MQVDLICFDSDSSKTVVDGRLEASGAMRQKDDPLDCLHFSLFFHFFYRWNINGHPTPDFIPVRESGKVVRPWYHELLFPGYEKASRGSEVT